MSKRLEQPLVAHVLSDEHGWNDSEEQRPSAVDSMLLLIATAGYFGSLWLLSGLAPLPMLASNARFKSFTNWRKTSR